MTFPRHMVEHMLERPSFVRRSRPLDVGLSTALFSFFIFVGVAR